MSWTHPIDMVCVTQTILKQFFLLIYSLFLIFIWIFLTFNQKIIWNRFIHFACLILSWDSSRLNFVLWKKNFMQFLSPFLIFILHKGIEGWNKYLSFLNQQKQNLWYQSFVKIFIFERIEFIPQGLCNILIFRWLNK